MGGAGGGSACIPDESCDLAAQPCKVGAIDCSGDEPSCVAVDDVADGTACGDDQVCSGGVCYPCTEGASCAPTNPCTEGIVACGSGLPVCNATGVALENGTDCPGGMCWDGACTSWELQVVHSPIQALWPLELQAELLLRIETPQGAGVPDRLVTMSPPASTGLPQVTATTDAVGIARFAIRNPRLPGEYHYVFSADHVDPVEVMVPVDTPWSEAIYSVVGGSFTRGSTGIPGLGFDAQIDEPAGLAAAASGDVYFAEGCRIHRLATTGLVETIAGGACGTTAGNGGPAVQATFGTISDVALTPTAELYVADRDNAVVRVIDLMTGTVTAAAGGGAAGAPDYGAGGAASGANFGALTTLAIGWDGAVYIGDDLRDRIWRLDPATATIGTWLQADPACTGAVAVASCGDAKTGCGVTFASGGDAFVAAEICGTAVGSPTFGIVRRVAADGSFVHVAGSATGELGNDIVATGSRFLAVPGLALDFEGNLLVTDRLDHRLRRIERWGRIIGISGASGQPGSSGDFNGAFGARLDGPTHVEVVGENLVVVDAGNFALREIYAAAPPLAVPPFLFLFDGDGQTATVGTAPALPLVLRVTDFGGMPFTGARITWEAGTPGGSVDAQASLVDANGLTQTTVVLGATPGSYAFNATLTDILGGTASTTFTLQATAAP